MLADLHMHTTFSDGVNTPEELVREAEKAHLCAMAITDHDNTCLLYTSPIPRDRSLSRMPSSA